MEFAVTVIVSGGASRSVNWNVSGRNDSSTMILPIPGSNRAILSVANNETAGTLTITATSTVDDSQSGSAVVSVISGIGGIYITPSEITVLRGQEQQFEANVTVTGMIDLPRTVTWLIVSGHDPGTAISNDGLLSVSATQTPAALIIRATSTYDQNRYGETTITVPGTAQLPAPVNPVLSEAGVASWTAPANETNIESYSVQLYRGQTILGAPVVINRGTLYSHSFLDAMLTAGAGSYAFRVRSVTGNPNFTDSAEVPSSARSVVQRPQAVNLSWNGDAAVWAAGPGDTTGLGYTIRLYRDAGPTAVREYSPVTGTTQNFAADITALGDGAYTFKVTALGNAALVLEAAETDHSPVNLKMGDVWLVGTMTGWNLPGLLMTQTGNTFIWEGNVAANSTFRFSLTNTTNWGDVNWYAPPDPYVSGGIAVVLGDPENNMFRFNTNPSQGANSVTENTWRITEAGLYRFIVKPAEMKLRVEKQESVADFIFEIVDRGSGLDIAEGLPTRTIYKTGGANFIPGVDDTVTFRIANPDSGAVYTWRVGNVTLPGTTPASIMLNAAQYPVGYHSVRLIVTINGIPWSLPTELGFTVAAVKLP